MSEPASSDCCQCAASSVLRLVVQLQQVSAGQWQTALEQVLKEICTLLACDNAIFIGWRWGADAAQAKACPLPDTCGGWKPCLLMDALGSAVRQDRLVREWAGFVGAHGPDPLTLDVLNGAACTLDSSAFVQQCPADCSSESAGGCDWLHCGGELPPAVADRIIATQALDPLSKGAICVERFKGGSFGARQHETLELLMDATADWQRRALNGHGLFREQKSLSPRERDILGELLTTAPEKQIAAKLGLTVRTTHQYVTSVYRKMQVHSRAELMARFFNA